MKAGRAPKTIRPKHIKRKTTMSSMMNAMENGKKINDLDDKDVEDDAENIDMKCLP